jgi:mannose-6-phosphate isomerase-like protein (cupin superfamily)
MKRTYALVVALVLMAGWSSAPFDAAQGAPSESRGAQAPAPPPAKGGYILQRDAEVAKNEPGTHNGGGQTVGYSFFANASPKLKLVFRKRAFKPGSAIGYHLQREDEIYYVLSGKGMMTVDDKSFEVGPGDAVLTRPGSSHGLKQVGTEDLVILINYEQAVN